MCATLKKEKKERKGQHTAETGNGIKMCSGPGLTGGGGNIRKRDAHVCLQSCRAQLTFSAGVYGLSELSRVSRCKVSVL